MVNRAFVALPLVMLCSGCLTRPAFVPVPMHVFSGFEALREPRTDLPVGALWIDGYGPTGEAAASDNLVTTKSLTGVTFDNGFQASLTLGLLKFLDLDPSYSRKMTAHFGDLSLVRIKDFSKLSGPAEQPRIYEALKAGTITITAIGNVGLDIENRAVSQHLPVFGHGTSAIARSFTIDGRDMFIAFQVATSRKVSSDISNMRLSPGQIKRSKVGPVDVTLAMDNVSGKTCPSAAVRLEEIADGQGERSTGAGFVSGGTKTLRVPVSDGQGGLFTSVELVDVSQSASKTCEISVRARLNGIRIERKHPTQPNEF